MGLSNRAVHELYQEAPYDGGIHPLTHPERTAATARLHGIPAVHPSHARIIELGCSSGRNLIAIARRWPDAKCTGVDFIAGEIENAKASAQNLPSVQFHQRDLLEMPSEPLSYDYIICHGVFSWVADEVKEAILRFCRDSLSPHGVALISYNTYPGWLFREAVRQVLPLDPGQSPQARHSGSKRTLAFLEAAFAERQDPYGLHFKEELERVKAKLNTIFSHDEAGPINDPCYFLQFVEWANEYGLSYIGESTQAELTPDFLPAAAQDSLRQLQLDRLRYEQLVDYIINRSFRSSLLCRSNLTVSRENNSGELTSMSIQSQLRPSTETNAADPHSPAIFQDPASGFSLSVKDPLSVAALYWLAQAEKIVPYPEVLAQARSAIQAPTASDTVFRNILLQANLRGQVTLSLT